MTQEEWYNKTDEVLSRFKNGEERRMRSALFNKVIQMLVRDVSPYEIIDGLIQTNEDTLKAFEDFMIRDTRHEYKR